MKKFILISGLAVSSLFSQEGSGMNVVDYTVCITDSKYGKEEQKNIDQIRTQLSTLVSETEKELKDLDAKFDDTAFLDSLSPKAEEELKARHQALQEDLKRYQWQFGQIMQQASYQLYQKMTSQIARASEKIAQENDLDYVINKEACSYYRPALDMTQAIIAEMDKNFDLDTAQKKVSQATPATGEADSCN